MDEHCKHTEWIFIRSHDMEPATLVYGPGLNVADELRWCIGCGALQRVLRGNAEAWTCPRRCTEPSPVLPSRTPGGIPIVESRTRPGIVAFVAETIRDPDELAIALRAQGVDVELVKCTHPERGTFYAVRERHTGWWLVKGVDNGVYRATT